MEPIAETMEAERLYGPFELDNEDLLERLQRVSDEVSRIAPTCVGLSLTVSERGVTFTLVGRDTRVASADAAEAADPATEQSPDQVAPAPESRTVEEELLDETRWTAFAATTAAYGVASSLTLPVMEDGVAVAAFNLYGSAPDTFEGCEEQIAHVLGAWLPGAIRDADLSFSTIEQARRAPEVLRESTRLVVATALLARRCGLTVEESENRLRATAAREGLQLPTLVEAVIDLLRGRRPAS